MDKYASSQSRGLKISVVKLGCTCGYLNFVGANPTLSTLRAGRCCPVRIKWVVVDVDVSKNENLISNKWSRILTSWIKKWGDNTINNQYMGRWAELVTQRAVNPWPSGIVGSSPTRPTIEGRPQTPVLLYSGPHERYIIIAIIRW